MATGPVPIAESGVLRAFAEKTPGSRALHSRAKALFRNGVTHVSRFLDPFPIYVERASGSRKWDVDGNEYVDYIGGHGVLILGHNHPAVVDAVIRQAAKGAHYGACHALEVEWAEQVQRLIPSAQRLCFTVTGTEATHLALRVSRAFTGRSKIIRFAEFFHGWHDYVCFPPGGAPGVIDGIVKDTLHGVLLIFDEVISGFRCAPGGAQQYYSVAPDLTTLAKIVGGGYPGAALAGPCGRASRAGLPVRRNAAISFGRTSGNLQCGSCVRGGGNRDAPRGQSRRRAHPRGSHGRRDSRWNQRGHPPPRPEVVPPYGQFSDLHLYCGNETPEEIYTGKAPWKALKGAIRLELVNKIRAGFLLHGVDIAAWSGGFTFTAHTDDDVARTVAAFESTLDLLASEGAL
jgi:glutamate-1-semialdehyde 2,1-aminomutase